MRKIKKGFLVVTLSWGSICKAGKAFPAGGDKHWAEFSALLVQGEGAEIREAEHRLDREEGPSLHDH